MGTKAILKGKGGAETEDRIEEWKPQWESLGNDLAKVNRLM